MKRLTIQEPAVQPEASCKDVLAAVYSALCCQTAHRHRLLVRLVAERKTPNPDAALVRELQLAWQRATDLVDALTDVLQAARAVEPLKAVRHG